jgi:hypothetical protein
MKLGDSITLIFKLLESVPNMGLTFTTAQITGLRTHLAELREKHPSQEKRWARMDALIEEMAAKHIDTL